jgi:hypothetical protein
MHYRTNEQHPPLSPLSGRVADAQDIVGSSRGIVPSLLVALSEPLEHPDIATRHKRNIRSAVA